MTFCLGMIVQEGIVGIADSRLTSGHEIISAKKVSFDFYAIVGGQLEQDKEHLLYLVYPQGNWVEIGKGLHTRSSGHRRTASPFWIAPSNTRTVCGLP